MVNVSRPVFFRDFTWANRLLVGLAVGLLSFMGAKRLAERGWQRQYWRVGVCSPQKNMFTLLSGDLILDDDYALPLDEDRLKFDDTTPICQPCENFSLGYRQETNVLLPPATLDLAWASLSERRFYRGTFGLPKARIDSLFARYRANPDTTWRFDREPREYDPADMSPATVGGLVLVVQIGVGGRVSLNVLVPTADQQGHVEQELAHFQATPYQPAWREESTYEYYFYAKTPQAYLDTLVSRIDSAGYYRNRRWHP